METENKGLIDVRDCPCDGCQAKPCGHPARCVKFTLWLNKTVDAVEVEQYKELVERYHELRENFVDYYCSGIPNVAPYCLNKCEECVTGHGWCKFNSDKCKGFNPAEVILDEERKDNERKVD